jgi:GTPase SAR1 family protein
MDPLKNPFAPGAGSQPPELAGRSELLQRAQIALARLKEGLHAKSLMILGLRGVGKTVLLNRIKLDAQTQGYKTAYIEAVEGRRLPLLLLPHLRRILFDLDAISRAGAATRRALRVLRSFFGAIKIKTGDVEFGLDIEPLRGEADSGDLETDLAAVFVAAGEAAKAQGSAILILLDEVQYLTEEDLSALILAVHRVTQERLPITVMGAGLPQVAALTGQAKSYAERLFDFQEVGPLDRAEAAQAIVEPIERKEARIELPATELVVSITRGYPYFLQEWGYNIWNTAPASPIMARDVEHSQAATIRSLDQGFFRVRYDRMTPGERRYVRAMAELGSGPHRSGDIAKKLGKDVQQVAPVRNNLIRKGMIYSPAHGDTAFTVPLFDEFLRRMMPEFE